VLLRQKQRAIERNEINNTAHTIIDIIKAIIKITGKSSIEIE